MHTHTSGLVRGGVLLVALVASLAMFVSSTARAEAQIDISGDWIVTEDSLGAPSPCAATVTQTGTGLAMVLEDCASLPGQQGTFSGTIDTATGDFSLSGTFTSGLALDLTGTASPDGNSISGSFTGPLPGTFDGVRQLAATSAAAVAAAVPKAGSGGYLDQSSSGLPMVAWLALAGASLAVLCLGVGLRARTRRG